MQLTPAELEALAERLYQRFAASARTDRNGRNLPAWDELRRNLPGQAEALREVAREAVDRVVEIGRAKKAAAAARR